MSYLFTSESVSEGHPDKVSDQISDALVDAVLSKDPNSKVACETLVTTGLVVCAGEVKTNGYVPVDDIARRVIKKVSVIFCKQLRLNCHFYGIGNRNGVKKCSKRVRKYIKSILCQKSSDMIRKTGTE
jgi:S-adenosylmethionine synthetase